MGTGWRAGWCERTAPRRRSGCSTKERMWPPPAGREMASSGTPSGTPPGPWIRRAASRRRSAGWKGKKKSAERRAPTADGWCGRSASRRPPALSPPSRTSSAGIGSASRAPTSTGIPSARTASRFPFRIRRSGPPASSSSSRPTGVPRPGNSPAWDFSPATCGGSPTAGASSSLPTRVSWTRSPTAPRTSSG